MRKQPFAAARIASYVLVALFVMLTVLPFLYMISLSLQTQADTFSGYPVLIPSHPQFRNYIDIFKRAPFGRFISNSFIVAATVALSHLFFDPLAGYVFAKYRFPLRDVLLLVVLGTLMIPFSVRMIPLYVMVSRWGWVDSYQALTTPFLMGAYGIFLMRQFMLPLPSELIDAGRIDGCSEFGIYWRIILPQCKPALATLGLFIFIFQWNDFLWPLIVVNSTVMRTMTIGLTLFNQEYFTQWHYTAAAGMLMFAPALVLFLFTQRYFVRGVVLSGMR